MFIIIKNFYKNLCFITSPGSQKWLSFSLGISGVFAILLHSTAGNKKLNNTLKQSFNKKNEQNIILFVLLL
ncbi:hypothetical protein Q73_06185 [Bacillus coahuilensis m2-6]|nr:hypothetical protein Q73_06185 [Bacillus coahuilensis m2-6]